VICDLCGRRAYGCVVKGLTYYRCSPEPDRHRHLPWYDGHPAAAIIREDTLTSVLQQFLDIYVGPSHDTTSPRVTSHPHDATSRERAIDAAGIPEEALHGLLDALRLEMRFTATTGTVTVHAITGAGTPADRA
jgi:hypothetical protein